MRVLAMLVLAGCGGFVDRQAAASTYRILQRSTEAARRQADVQLARDAMPGGLLQLEAFALAYPDAHAFRDLHAEALCQYGVAFLFDDWEDAKLGQRDAEAARIAERLEPLLDRCVDANLDRLPPAWRSARARGPDGFAELAPAATRAQVSPLLWIATVATVRLGLDPLHHLAELPSIEALLARCAQLSPGFHDADAELLLATLAAGRAQVFGGDDGGQLFDRARELAGDGALIVDVMFARGTAIARKDRAAFDATLEKVLATDASRWPDRRLANELARRKARRYQAAAAVLWP